MHTKTHSKELQTEMHISHDSCILNRDPKFILTQDILPATSQDNIKHKGYARLGGRGSIYKLLMGMCRYNGSPLFYFNGIGMDRDFSHFSV